MRLLWMTSLGSVLEHRTDVGVGTRTSVLAGGGISFVTPGAYFEHSEHTEQCIAQL